MLRPAALVGFLTLRSFDPVLQGEAGLSPRFTPRLPFHKRLPRQVYGQGIDRLDLHYPFVLVADRITDVHCGSRVSPVASGW